MNGTLLSQIFGFLAIISGFLTVIGLIRPGFVVWWTEKKSRGSAFAVWGSILVVSIIGYWLTNSTRNDPHKVGVNKHTQWKMRYFA